MFGETTNAGLTPTSEDMKDVTPRIGMSPVLLSLRDHFMAKLLQVTAKGMPSLLIPLLVPKWSLLTDCDAVSSGELRLLCGKGFFPLQRVHKRERASYRGKPTIASDKI